MQWERFLQALHRKLRSQYPKSQIYDSRTEQTIISLISENPQAEELIASWLSKQSDSKPSKSSEDAKNAKNSGNNYFKQKDYLKSLAEYSKSAKYSSDKEDFAIAIANRSASLFHMCRYSECLSDIQIAIESGYPKKLLHKVLLRSAHCHIKLRDSKAAEAEIQKAKDLINSDTFKSSDKENLMDQISVLSKELDKIPKELNKKETQEMITPEKLLEINENYPSASKSLSRDYSPTRGRFVKATEEIKKGEILYVEKPFAFVPLDHETSDFVCGNCCGRLCGVSYPCRNCSEIGYCSPKCWRESWGMYHQWECPGYNMGIWKQIGIAHLAIKVLLVSGTTEDTRKFNEVQKLVTNIELLGDDDLMVYSIVSNLLLVGLRFKIFEGTWVRH